MINIIYSIIPVVCLTIGFLFGFKIGKTSEIPKISNETKEKIKHPIKTISEEKEQKETISKLDKALKNLNEFDGTISSQEEI